jgi:hypothetical protein
MLDSNPVQNYMGPTTTADSSSDGRLMVDIKGMRKRKKSIIKKYLTKNK